MTTEVLRNMLFSGSALLAGLRPSSSTRSTTSRTRTGRCLGRRCSCCRPPEVVFVCLSATVNNALELGGWLRSVRGPTEGGEQRAAPADHAAPPRGGAPTRGRTDPPVPAAGGRGAHRQRGPAGRPGGPAGPPRTGAPLPALGAAPATPGRRASAVPEPPADRAGRPARGRAQLLPRHRVHLQSGGL